MLANGDVQSTKISLKQDRPRPEKLRQIWLQKVGWKPENADDHWSKAGGDSKGFDKHRSADGSECHVDHVVELQFGGDNVPENLRMLDGPENVESGRTIFTDLKDVAVKVRQAFIDDKVDTGGAKNILVHYDQVQQSGLECKTCCHIEDKARDLADVKIGEGESVGGKKGTPYPFQAGSTKATVIVLDEKKTPVPLDDSEVPENKSVSTLISGLNLRHWNRKGKGGGTVDAALDNSGKSRFPATFHPDEKSKPVSLIRRDDGNLKLAAGQQNLKFHFDYLSDGAFTRLEMDDDGNVSGAGKIKPSISFLPEFEVRFDKEKFELAKPIPKDKLKLPIPGLKIEKAEVVLQLGPEFKPAGVVEFSLEAGKRRLLDGKVELSADAQGLVIDGDVQVSLPGVDHAGGKISYRNGQWSGRAEISTTQLKEKLKYVKSGGVVVLFSEHGMSADGTVMLDLPGTKGVEAHLLYESSKRKWIFKGKGAFQPKGLKEVDIEVQYDGEHIEGSASTGFEFHGLNGTIHVVYRDEKFSGDGSLEISKGKAKGSLHVKMREVNGEPKFSGDGTVSYQLTENLIATAGIEINEKEEVRLKGALEFPKPIELFKPVEGEYKFFEIGISIPIPGASIGPAGVQARIDGSLSAGYKLGPGELRNTKLEAAFNPLDAKPDADVTLTATLFIGASAHISGRIAGSIVLDAVVASVSGGIAITATASLDGHVASQVTLHYSKSRFEADANFELLVGLALTLALDAFVKAKAGNRVFQRGEGENLEPGHAPLRHRPAVWDETEEPAPLCIR